MYVVTKGDVKREYETQDTYKALADFKKELGLSSLEDVFVRSFGGVDIPAVTLWPRARKRTSDSHNVEVV